MEPDPAARPCLLNFAIPPMRSKTSSWRCGRRSTTKAPYNYLLDTASRRWFSLPMDPWVEAMQERDRFQERQLEAQRLTPPWVKALSWLVLLAIAAYLVVQIAT